MKPNRRLLNYLAASSIDRMALKRKDEKWLAEQLKNPATRVVPVWRDMHLVKYEDKENPAAVFPAYEELKAIEPGLAPEILLGMDKESGTIYFTVELPEHDAAAADKWSGLGVFRTLRQISARINRNESALLAYAQAMTYWHRSHRFCGTCGSLTRNAEAGHLRVCTEKSCDRHHFPRTDPAVIVLVSAGDYCLLGRSARWPKGMYSTIAGFVEPGESLELAVAREVAEETGVHVDPARVVYHSSQPWPFPASIMLGFTVQTDHQEIRIDPDELEDARWFSRMDIQHVLDEGTFRLPSVYSIAYRLIEDWRNQRGDNFLK
jgi:NAD+ diphosphatase